MQSPFTPTLDPIDAIMLPDELFDFLQLDAQAQEAATLQAEKDLDLFKDLVDYNDLLEITDQSDGVAEEQIESQGAVSQ